MKAQLAEIKALTTLIEEIEPLAVEAEKEGHHFMRRLCEEWISGSNRFDHPGEVFLGVFASGQLVGVGGINRDPYANADRIGRLRHVYVLAATRGLGVGSILVERLVSEAAKTFDVIRLRTTSAKAATFYERLGFNKTCEEAASHRLECDRLP